jgi:hypothetical protein
MLRQAQHERVEDMALLLLPKPLVDIKISFVDCIPVTRR